MATMAGLPHMGAFRALHAAAPLTTIRCPGDGNSANVQTSVKNSCCNHIAAFSTTSSVLYLLYFLKTNFGKRLRMRRSFRHLLFPVLID